MLGRGRAPGRVPLALLVVGALVLVLAACSGGGSGAIAPTVSVTETSSARPVMESTPAWLLKYQQDAARIKTVMTSVKLPPDFVADGSWLLKLGHDCSSWHYFGCWRNPDPVEQIAQVLEAAVDSSGVASKVDLDCTQRTFCTVAVRTPAGLATYHVLSFPSEPGSFIFGIINA